MRKDYCLCFNDSYTPYASVTIKSIINSGSVSDDICIHVVTDYLSKTNEQKLRSIADIEKHIVDSSVLTGLKTGIWSPYTWYRILLPEILPDDIHRILYLDCDIVVNNALDDLFTMEMDGHTIAACLDCQSYDKSIYHRLGYGSESKYVCAGVLLMNLDEWRSQRLSQRILEYAHSNSDKLVFPDQDTINVICSDDKIILPPKYGVLVQYFLHPEFIKEHRDDLRNLLEKPAIIHYAGYQPWVYAKNKSPHSRLWWKTYYSLHSSPIILTNYILSIVKFYIRLLASYSGLLSKDNPRYLLSQYYFHKKITSASILRQIEHNDSIKHE